MEALRARRRCGCEKSAAASREAQEIETQDSGAEDKIVRAELRRRQESSMWVECSIAGGIPYDLHVTQTASGLLARPSVSEFQPLPTAEFPEHALRSMQTSETPVQSLGPGKR